MPTLPAHKIEEMEQALDELDVERALTYSLADAMREQAGDIEQIHGTWVSGERVCALSKVAMVAKARHLI